MTYLDDILLILYSFLQNCNANFDAEKRLLIDRK